MSKKEMLDKRIVITGGAGFLGSHLIEKLKSNSYKQVLSPESRKYDLRHSDDINRMFEFFNPDIIIHLAANAGGIGYNRENPASLFYDNLMMGAQLLHESYKRYVEKFVGVGTICSYPKFPSIPFKEENLWDGYPEETNAPYGLAKKMLLVQSQAYRDQFGFNAIHLLPVNLYGPRDRGFFNVEKSHVIPDMIRKFSDARDKLENEVVLFGDGSPTREFLYVEDAAEGIMLATEGYNGRDPVNLGNGMEISIKDLAEKIKNIVGFKGGILWDTSKPNGQPRRCLDVSKAKEEFGFVAKTDFDTGLENTIRWYEENK